MNLDRLLLLLRCLECNGRLRLEHDHLICRACGEAYPLEDDIPILVKKDTEDEQWAEYFNRISRQMGDTEAANQYFSCRNFRFVRARLLNLIGPVEGLTILDVGCGTGHFSQALSRANLVVGVDISLNLLRFAQKKGIAGVHSSAKRLPFAAGCFDLVIANNVIQSIRQGHAFIRELSRVAKPGSRLLISTTNGENFALTFLRPLEKRKHERLEAYKMADLIFFCAQAGWSVEENLFLFFPFGFVKRTEGSKTPGFCGRYLSTTLAVFARKLEESSSDD